MSTINILNGHITITTSQLIKIKRDTEIQWKLISYIITC
jgi:hypothetical protein